MQRISVILIVKNEARCLASCLDAVESVVDEIVVVDTGSTDNTIQIATARANTILHFDWCNDFSAARNVGIDGATGDWCLTLDADEVVQDSAAARTALLAFASGQLPHTVGTIAIESLNAPGDDAQLVTHHTERFFKRGQYRYGGPVHEQLVAVTGEKTRAPTGLRVVHSGYIQAHDDSAHKAHRNISILEAALEKQPRDEYLWYQLGKSHYSLKHYGPAVQAFEQAGACIDFTAAYPQGQQGLVARSVLTDLATSLAYAYVNMDKVGQAYTVLERHEALGHAGTQWADFPHALGYVYLMLGEIEKSRAAYRAALAIGPAREDVQGTGSFACHYHLGLLAEADKNLPQALSHYRDALQRKPDYGVAIQRCVDFAVEYGVALPPDVAGAISPGLLEARWLATLLKHLAAGSMDAARVLVQAAPSISQDLLVQCKTALEAFLAQDNDTES